MSATSKVLYDGTGLPSLTGSGAPRRVREDDPEQTDPEALKDSQEPVTEPEGGDSGDDAEDPEDFEFDLA